MSLSLTICHKNEKEIGPKCCVVHRLLWFPFNYCEIIDMSCLFGLANWILIKHLMDYWNETNREKPQEHNLQFFFSPSEFETLVISYSLVWEIKTKACVSVQESHSYMLFSNSFKLQTLLLQPVVETTLVLFDQTQGLKGLWSQSESPRHLNNNVCFLDLRSLVLKESKGK